MIFLGKNYLALWDNDNEGRARLSKAIDQFGEIEGNRFLLLKPIADEKNTRLEEYFDKSEVENFNVSHLSLPNVPLYKTILSLFYDRERNNLIEKYFSVTKSNFTEIEKTMKAKIDAIALAKAVLN